MANYNRVMLIGNLTRDPELRYTPSGTAVVEIGLAVNENYKNKEGKIIEKACFVDITVWDRQAETCNEFLKKGSPVFIEGRLQFDQWETSEGEKRNKLRVRADRVQFLSSQNKQSISDDDSSAIANNKHFDKSEDDVPF